MCDPVDIITAPFKLLFGGGGSNSNAQDALQRQINSARDTTNPLKDTSDMADAVSARLSERQRLQALAGYRSTFLSGLRGPGGPNAAAAKTSIEGPPAWLDPSLYPQPGDPGYTPGPHAYPPGGVPKPPPKPQTPPDQTPPPGAHATTPIPAGGTGGGETHTTHPIAGPIVSSFANPPVAIAPKKKPVASTPLWFGNYLRTLIP